MSDQYRVSIVCILNARERILGAGFLVPDGRVVTCAHVVADALDIPYETPGIPDGHVQLSFPFIARGEIVKCKSHVIFWSPVSYNPEYKDEAYVMKYGSDIAVLQLDGAPPPGSRPGKLVAKEDLYKHSFRAFGFPAGYPNGIFATGIILDTLVNGWVQIEDSKKTGFFVAPGFSGTAVWDDDVRGIVGMVVASEDVNAEPASEFESQTTLRTAYIIPTTLLGEVYPKLCHVALPPCPYRDLSSFEERHAPFFFGRQSFTIKLAESVRKKPFVALTGPSGSGKSSLVYAGLLPLLRRDQGLLIAIFRPQEHPFFSLASALYPLCMPANEEDELTGIRNLSDHIRKEGSGLEYIVRFIREKHTAASSLLLVIDQFEELFTVCRDQEEVRFFLDTLCAAIRTNPYKFKHDLTLLIILRADFFGWATSYRPVADALQDAVLILSPMNREEMRDAIEKPARKMDVKVEEGLTERIIDAISHAPANLPLLEFTLSQLWEIQSAGTLTHAAYDDIGGVERSLTRHADEVYGACNNEERERIQRIFIQLVHPSVECGDTRRIVRRAELGEECWALASRLADERLVVLGRDEVTGDETIELIHEALIREWKLFSGWIEDNRTFLIWRERLHAQVYQWQICGRDDGALLRGATLIEAESWMHKRSDDLSKEDLAYIEAGVALREQEQAHRERRRRNITVSVSVGCIIAVILATAALAAWRRSEIERQIATARLLVNQSTGMMKHEPNLLPCSALLATEAMRRLQMAKASCIDAVQVLRQGVELLAGNSAGYKHTRDVTAVAFDPQGQFLATASMDNIIRLFAWRKNSSGEICRMPHNKVKLITFDPQGHYIVSAGDDNTTRLWKMPDEKKRIDRSLADEALQGEEAGMFAHDDNVTAIAVSPQGEYLLSASADGSIIIIEVASGKEMHRMWHNDYVSCVAFSPCGEYLASGSWDDSVRVWSVHEGKEVVRMVHDSHEGEIVSVAFSQNGAYVIGAGGGKTVHVWEVATGKQHEQMLHEDEILSASFSPDRQYMATITKDYTLHIWNIDTRHKISSVHYEDGLTALVFSRDGNYLATASADGTSRVWEVKSGEELIRVTHEERVNDVAFSRDGYYFATASRDRTARVWETTSIRKETCMAHDAEVTALNLSRDGRYLATVSKDHTARIWESGSCTHIACAEHRWPMQAVSFGPRGEYVATASADHQVRLWDVKSGAEFRRIDHDEAVYNAVISPHGRYIATVDASHNVQLWRGKSPRVITRLPHNGSVTAIAFSQDEKFVATGDHDGCAHVWNTLGGKKIARLEHPDEIKSLAFTKEGSCLATLTKDFSVKVWNLSDPNDNTTIPRKGKVVAACLSPYGTCFATREKGAPIRVWDMQSHEEITHMEYEGTIGACAISHDGRLLAAVVREVNSPAPKENKYTLRVWDMDRKEQMLTVTYPDEVMNLQFSPDGEHCASIINNDPYVHIWNIKSGKESRRMKHTWGIQCALFNPDGTILATASDDRTLRLWDPKSGEEIKRIPHRQGIRSFAFCSHPEGDYIASMGYDDPLVRLWHAQTGKMAYSLKHTGIVNAFTVSCDGKRLATACADRHVHVWETGTGKKLYALRLKKSVTTLALSPDGRLFATSSGDPYADIWETSGGKKVGRVMQEITREGTTHSFIVDVVAFSPQARHLASGNIEGGVWVWEIENQRKIAFLDHDNVLNCLVFSPDGNHLATACNDGTVHVWEIKKGQEIARMNHARGIHEVAFTSDGKFIMTASADHRVRKWLWRPDDMVKEACGRIRRNLTMNEWRRYIGNERYCRTCPDVGE